MSGIQFLRDAENANSIDCTKVTFRVTFKDASHGEDIYLVADGAALQDATRLHTSPRSHPWYWTKDPVSISLIGTAYEYRYAVFRGGVFFRWEEVEGARQLPLEFFSASASYMVRDLMDVKVALPDVIKVDSTSLNLTSAANLHDAHKSSSFIRKSSVSSLPNASRTSMHSFGQADSSEEMKVHFDIKATETQERVSQPQRTVNLSNSDGVVVVSVFLPVHLHRSDEGEWSAQWNREALLSMRTHLRVTRVGTVKWRGWHGNFGNTQDVNGKSPESGVPVDEREKVEKCLSAFHCVPVWCDPNRFGEMYNGFCKGVLWPTLHSVTSIYSDSADVHKHNDKQNSNQFSEFSQDKRSLHRECLDLDHQQTGDQFSSLTTDDVAFPVHGDGGREADLWSAYTEINRQVAEVVVQNFHEGDLVWIHGFHFMILPSMLTRKIPMAKIGLFSHTPFPSSEIFRTLWCREDLLRGMLNADQVGFHLFEYSRHFLTSCRRLLGLNYGMVVDNQGGHNLAIEVHGRQVVVTNIHAGIEIDVCNNMLRLPRTIEQANSIRKQHEGKVIFCAIDRIESLKGISLKLLGLQRFLERCPEWVNKIVLLQFGISAFERGDDYTRTKNELTRISAKINSTWPGTVRFVECKESEMRMHHRMSIMKAADVLVVTPLRDGLNLMPLEFTTAHQEGGRGVCILSEFSSCSRILRGALHVNPWKASSIARAFHQALTMSQDERLRRLECAINFVTRVTTQRWALAVMLDLKGVQKSSDASTYSGAGLGLGFRLLGMQTGFDSLDINKVTKSYKNSKSRLILLDYGGTILANDNANNLSRYQVVKHLRAPSVPTEKIMGYLRDLCSDKKNTVFVVSGKERHTLAETLGSIPRLGLAAEHGMFLSWPTFKVQKKRIWETMIPNEDRSWRSMAVSIMELYTSRTHGSYIEETEMKVLWQYRDADPEFGYLQSRELKDHLSNVLRAFNVDVLHGGVEEGGYVEVRPKGVNKGVVSMHIIQKTKDFARNRIDFALTIGDDHCDEPMLSVMRNVGYRGLVALAARNRRPPPTPLSAMVTLVDVSPCDEYVSPHLSSYTCTVGKKPSAAKYFLNEVGNVHELLECLIKVSTRVSKQYQSFADFRMLNINGPASPGTKNDNEGGGGLFLRSLSMCKISPTEPLPQIEVSQSLHAYMGNVEQPQEEEDEDALFF